jgi:hypothetical protein
MIEDRLMRSFFVQLRFEVALSDWQVENNEDTKHASHSLGFQNKIMNALRNEIFLRNLWFRYEKSVSPCGCGLWVGGWVRALNLEGKRRGDIPNSAPAPSPLSVERL